MRWTVEFKGGQSFCERQAYSGHLEVAKVRFAPGADVNAKDDEGKTPLSYAKEKGHSEVIQFLLGHGAK